MKSVVDALEACQASSGYLSAFSEELFDRYEAQKPVWAPYYTGACVWAIRRECG